MDTSTERRVTRRATWLFVIAALGAAGIGYITGLRGSERSVPGSTAVRQVAPELEHAQVQPSVTYRDMRSTATGPNRDWRTSLVTLDQPATDLFAATKPDDATKMASLVARERNRAYNGAPPTVPHSIDQMSSASCLACHRDGLVAGPIRASRMPHAFLTNCTQCHVAESADGLRARAPSENSFAGLPAPFMGDRAWDGAPPTVPHSTTMRTDCLACHGPAGPAGLRSSHPWRQSCLQCHAPSAVLDQHATSAFSRFLTDEPGPDAEDQQP